MPLLSYTTQVPVQNTAAEIIACLSEHNATAIGTEYDGRGKLIGMTFAVNTAHGEIPFRLPVDSEAIWKLMMRKNIGGRLGTREQAERVAWRQMYRWVQVQMATIETGMVALEQIFLPFAQTATGETLYEHMLKGKFQQLALTSSSNDKSLDK